ncbi:hypothetical protein FACS189465_2700 [Clostridia bacterium]|nr:hypothetical protein FACS189465_2700 [Clostridia bacterium]
MGKYIKNLVTDNDEKIIFETRHIRSGLTLWIIIPLFIMYISYPWNWTSKLHILFYIILIVGLAMIFGPIFLYHALKIFGVEFGFTNKRLISKKSGWHKNILEIPLEEIDDVIVEYRKGWYYEVIVVITFSGSYIFPNILRPKQFKDELLKQIEINKQTVNNTDHKFF